MTALLIGTGGPVLSALAAWLCTRAYYRDAYGDRYQRGYADGREAQIRAYQDTRTALDHYQGPRMLPAPAPPQYPYDAYDGEPAVTVLGSWYPEASGPPRYADLAPAQLDDDPPTSEWARDLIAGIEKWNAEYLPDRDLPWAG